MFFDTVYSNLKMAKRHIISDGKTKLNKIWLFYYYIRVKFFYLLLKDPSVIEEEISKLISYIKNINRWSNYNFKNFIWLLHVLETFFYSLI